jgi:hypothetical protein
MPAYFMSKQTSVPVACAATDPAAAIQRGRLPEKISPPRRIFQPDVGRVSRFSGMPKRMRSPVVASRLMSLAKIAK